MGTKGDFLKLYEAYLKEIIDRSKIELGPKPIDKADLVVEIIDIILEISLLLGIFGAVLAIAIMVFDIYKRNK